MYDQRLPIVDDDDGIWGDILRKYLQKEHYDTGVDNPDNGGHKNVTIRAGGDSAGGAPLKFASGALLTTPQIGAVEFVGDNLYVTQTSGTVRKKVALYDDASGTTGDIYYRNATGYFTRLAAGTASQILTLTGSPALPTWQTLSAYTSGGTDVSVADGGTGRSTSGTAYGILAAGTGTTTAHQTISPGTSGQFLKSAGASALAAFASITTADIASGTFAIGRIPTGTTSTTVSLGNHTHTKADIGLANVDNTSDASKPISTATQTALDGKLGVISVKAYGATGNGSTDDTTAVNNAYTAAAAANKSLYFPAGTYKLTALPALANNMRVVGDGRWSTTILYEGTGTLSTLTNKQYVEFADVNFWATGVGGKVFDLSGCFRLSFTNIVIRGQHTGANTTYQTQIGVNLRDNTGGTTFQNCDFNNLGIGLQTSCIENHIVNSKFATCWKSLRGVGGTANAGMYITNTEFVGGTNDQTTYAHIIIDGSANSWSLVNVWLEGCKYGAIIGSGSSGPSQFAMFGCKIGARTTGLKIDACRQTHLDNVEFDVDQNSDASPKEVEINSTNAVEGVALNLVTTLRSDFAYSDFPDYWFVVRKGQAKVGSLTLQGMGDNSDTVATTKGYVDWKSAWANMGGKPAVIAAGATIDEALSAVNLTQIVGGINSSIGREYGAYARNAIYTHPESDYFVPMPHLFNDIAYNNIRGGSVTVLRNGATYAPNGNHAAETFTPDATYSFVDFYTSTSDTIAIEITLHKTFYWNYRYGIQQTDWCRGQNVKFEAYNGGSWTTLSDKTNETTGLTWSDADAGGTGITKLRVSLTNFNTAPATGARITQIFLVGFDSGLLSGTFLPRGGGTLYGDLDAPGVRTDRIKDRTTGTGIVDFYHNASAVNYLQLQNRAAGAGPGIYAQGSDTNIDINLVPKGTGNVLVNGSGLLSASSSTILTNKTINLANNTVTGIPYDLSIMAFGTYTARVASSYGDFPMGIKLQRAVTFTQVVYRVSVADASGNLVVELRKNGTTVSGSSATIAAANQVTGGTATGTWAFASGDILTVYVTSVGSTPGAGLIADIRGITT